MFGHSTAEDYLLEVPALGDKTLGGILMGDTDNILFDDRTRIKIGSHIVAGGTDNLHSPLEGLMIGLCADEGREEGMMDVDYMMGILRYHLLADNLHIACKDNEGDLLPAEEFHLRRLYFGAVRAVGSYLPYVERNAEHLSDITKVLVVADDAGNLNIPLTGLIPGEKVVETMTHLRDEDCHSGFDVTEKDIEIHLVTGGEHSFEVLLYLLTGNEETVKFPLYPHKKDFVLVIDILVEIYDISAVVCNEFRYIRDNSLTVGAVHQENSCVCHYD